MLKKNAKITSGPKVITQGVLYRLFDVYSRMYTPGVGGKEMHILKGDEEWLISLADDTGIVVPHDLPDRAKRIQRYPIKK